ncbi:MAG: hypothetical protein WBQ21_14810 [Solirubrobacteraceae bacterium]
MKVRLYSLGRVTVLATAFGLLLACMSAASASAAEVEWRQGGIALSAAVEYNSPGTFKLIDSSRFNGSLSLSCEASIDGKAGPGAGGEVTNLGFSSCNRPATECSEAPAIEIEDLNLPWHSELVIAEKPHDVISSGGKGSPGLRIYCTVSSVPHVLVDECSGTLRTSAVDSTSGVEESFDGEQLSCKHLSVASKGTVEGTLLGQSNSGPKLEVTQHENWLQGEKALTGSIATKTSGTIKLSNGETGGWEVECKDSGEGTAGTSGLDEQTKLSFSSCTFVSKGPCEAGVAPTIVAVDLPWHSELVLSEGLPPQTHDVSFSGGTGSPGFRMGCSVGEIFKTDADECTAPVLKTSAKNVGAGVEGPFDGEKLTCKSTKKATGVLEGTQLIEANTGSALEVPDP